MEKENTINKTIYYFSEKMELLQTIIIGMIAFFVPSFLAQIMQIVFGAQSILVTHSQIVVGSIVNMALIITAMNVKGWKKIIGIITMPSISTIMSGYVLGTASPYMIYMIPAIWLGNLALIFAYKYLMLENHKNYFFAGAVGIAIKVLIIFGSFEGLAVLKMFPEKIMGQLQNAMGMTQFITANIGMGMAFVIYYGEKKKQTKE